LRLDGTWKRFTMNCAAMRAKRLGETANERCIIDSQSVKTTKRGAARLRCWQEINAANASARRCFWVGACCVVHPADVQTADGARLVLALLRHTFTRLRLIWADGGYAGQLLAGFGIYGVETG